MRRFSALCAVFLAAVLALAGCGDPTEGISEAQVNTPAPAVTEPVESPEAPAEAAPESGADTDSSVRFVLTPDSTIGFEGYKVTGSHIGGFGSFDGHVEVPGDDLTQAVITVTIDMNSTYSDDPGLTTKLKGPDFFDVEQFPQARFQSTSIAAAESGYTVTGDLELHGVTQSISFPATIQVSADGLIAEAEFTINRMDFGIEYAGVADDLIREKVVIRLDVEGVVGAE